MGGDAPTLLMYSSRAAYWYNQRGPGGTAQQSHTHSLPKGGITLSNTDMIYADFNPCIAFEGTQFSRFGGEALRYLEPAVWCVNVCTHMLVCVHTVCLCSWFKWKYCQGVYSALPREAGRTAAALLHPNKLPHIDLPVAMGAYNMQTVYILHSLYRTQEDLKNE